MSIFVFLVVDLFSRGMHAEGYALAKAEKNPNIPAQEEPAWLWDDLETHTLMADTVDS